MDEREGRTARERGWLTAEAIEEMGADARSDLIFFCLAWFSGGCVAFSVANSRSPLEGFLAWLAIGGLLAGCMAALMYGQRRQFEKALGPRPLRGAGRKVRAPEDARSRN